MQDPSFFYWIMMLCMCWLSYKTGHKQGYDDCKHKQELERLWGQDELDK